MLWVLKDTGFVWQSKNAGDNNDEVFLIFASHSKNSYQNKLCYHERTMLLHLRRKRHTTLYQHWKHLHWFESCNQQFTWATGLNIVFKHLLQITWLILFASLSLYLTGNINVTIQNTHKSLLLQLQSSQITDQRLLVYSKWSVLSIDRQNYHSSSLPAEECTHRCDVHWACQTAFTLRYLEQRACQTAFMFIYV